MLTVPYLKTCKLGEGTFGAYYKAKDKYNYNDVKFVALKKIRLEYPDNGIEAIAIRNIAILKELKHPNIVSFYDVIYTEKRFTIVFEFMDNNDLANLLNLSLEKRKHLINNYNTKMLIKSYLYQLLSAINYIHKKGIIHRNICPQKIMLTNNFKTLKLTHFDNAIISSSKNKTNNIISSWYRSPDLLLGNTSYSTSVDIWSIGCIFAEMINTKALFGDYGDDQLNHIFTLLGYPSNTFSPQIISLATKYKYDILHGEEINDFERRVDIKTRLFNKAPGFVDNYKNVCLSSLGIDLLIDFLRYDPNKRITAMNALNHSFFVSDKWMIDGYIRRIQIEFDMFIPSTLIRLLLKYYLQIDDQYATLKYAFSI